MVDSGESLVVGDIEGVAHEVRMMTETSRVWSGRSSGSCRGGEGRLDVLGRRCALGGKGVLVPLQI
jgi:hypothetical protein